MLEVGQVLITAQEYRELVRRVEETKNYEGVLLSKSQLKDDLKIHREFLESSSYYKEQFEKFINEKGDKDNG